MYVCFGISLPQFEGFWHFLEGWLAAGFLVIYRIRQYWVMPTGYWHQTRQKQEAECRPTG